jgi:hypothetical protein
MSDNENFGFGKLVPGFDFLQNLAKGASQMPNLSNWVAPTLNPEELEKRIGELKAVHFWLDQNSKALGATIQALEVQKMTLATLKGMNFNMGDVANAFKLKTAESVTTGAQKVSEKAAHTVNAISSAAGTSKAPAKKVEKAGGQPAAGIVDPLQWWGALTQQFQQIAAGALKDAAAQAAAGTAKNVAAGVAKEAFKTAGGVAAKAATATTTGSARKRAARRATPKK